MTVYRILSGLLVLLVTVLLGGCAASRPSPEAVIDRAISAIEEVQTYRVDWTTVSPEGEGTITSNMVIEFVSPDRLHLLPQNELDVSESIMVGRTQYYRGADSAEWQLQQLSESAVTYNPAVIMVEGLESLVDLTELSDEEIDGFDCFHYRGRVDMEAIAGEQIAKLDPSEPGYEAQKMTLEQVRQSTTDRELWTEFWIGKSDYLLRQLQHGAGDDTKAEHANVRFTSRFFDFNAPIEIEPPPDEDVVITRPGKFGLVANSVSSIGGDDPAHQRISYEITISNRGPALAEDVRVFVDTGATNEGLQTLEAEAARQPVNLVPGENEVFQLN